MRSLLTLHRYLAIIVAPIILFYIFTGALQSLHLHERQGKKTTAMRIVQRLSAVHLQTRITGIPRTIFRATVVTVCLLFVTSALIGVGVGYQMTRPRWLFWVCILIGTILLTCMGYIAYTAPKKPLKKLNRQRAQFVVEGAHKSHEPTIASQQKTAITEGLFPGEGYDQNSSQA